MKISILFGLLLCFSGLSFGVENDFNILFENLKRPNQIVPEKTNEKAPEKKSSAGERAKNIAQRFGLFVCFVFIEHMALKPLFEHLFPSDERQVAEKLHTDLEQLRNDYEILRQSHAELVLIQNHFIKNMRN